MQNTVPSTSKHVRRIIVEPITRGKVRVWANAYFDAYDTSWANANAIVVVEGKRKDISDIAKTVINELAVKAVNGVTIDDGARAELDRLAA